MCLAALGLLVLVTACGADGGDAREPPGTGGQGAQAPAGGSSGTEGDTGGTESAGTGATPVGGRTGGNAATGGSPAGGASTGGSPAGGAATGGSPLGGANAGGVATGGAAIGGSLTGGASAGGASTGGSPAGGGDPGGAPSTGGAGAGGSGVDVFGIQELYPSAPSGARWTSQHWASGTAYSIDERLDTNDPQGLSGMRGTGTLDITGTGELIMGGSQPRIYVYPGAEGPWRDVEVTAYYMRVADDATAWGGLVIGARSGPEGHSAEVCDAHTYYNRLRHDGAMDFEKELMHTPSSTQNRIDPTDLWPDGNLPFDTWIGLKYVIYNLANGGVKLESYRDLTEGAGGGDWVLISEYTENGGWFCQTTCSEHNPVNGESDLVWLEGGVTFIRNTGVTEARYKWFSVREIAP